MKKIDYKLLREYNIRKILIISFISIIAVSIIVFFSFYIAESGFRKWVDINILRKEIKTEDVKTIYLDATKNNQVFCYSKYIAILNDKNLKIYNSIGDIISESSIDINTAVFTSSDKNLIIAEKGGQNICAFLDKDFSWEQKVDGEIYEIYVNKNGYVALITTDTTYKSIITVLNPSGKQILKNYLSSTRVVDVSISNDNKFIAFAELDTSGAIIKSNVKVISVENAQNDPDNAIISDYNIDNLKLVMSVKYQDKNILACMLDQSIKIFGKSDGEETIEIGDNITFSSVELNNSVVYIEENSSGVFNSNSVVNIVNVQNGHKSIYNIDEVAKEMYTYNNIIGINVGTDIYFINTNGTLLKKYTSNQEINNVMLSNDLAIIMMKDRIKIINL